jgi:hypothetical protein
MRLALSLIAICAVAACNGKQSFDERYKTQSDHISATANSIQKQVADQMTGAAAAERAAAETQARTRAPDNSATAP